MQQFRVILKDDNDNFESVIMESEVFPGNNWWDSDFSDAQYKELLELDDMFNLVDYDNVPSMEFQRRVALNGVWEEWKYYSDPVEDYFNL